MQLSKNTVGQIKTQAGLEIPSAKLFELPEKVLQFGTGVLLRALPDYFIDKANKQGIFNGRVVVVKSTDSDSSDFDKQDGLYTICVRGVENGKTITIEAKNNSLKNPYIQSATLNGKAFTKNWISYSDLMKGAVIKYQMSDKPNKFRGIAPEDRPYSVSQAVK